MKKLMIIHTTPATIQSLTNLVSQEMPGVEAVNILDDSILKDMVSGRNVELVEKRWITYASMWQAIGADAVLSACSTVGEFAEKADRQFPVPVLRIDEAMAEEAVKAGSKISVFATLRSTLDPTVDLIRRKAQAAGKSCTVTTNLVEGAYDQLMAGNRDEHNRRIREQVASQIADTDVVVLAQASMAGALEGFEERQMSKILTSPLSGIRHVRDVLTAI